MTEQIISLKIATRVLQGDKHSWNHPKDLDVFPFERVYLTRSAGIARRLFRYYLSMPLTSLLLRGLNRVRFTCTVTTGLGREKTTKSHTLSEQNEQLSGIELSDNWLLIVPTKTTTKVVNRTLLTVLEYVTVRRNFYGVNQTPELPAITLHTPSAETYILCAKCSNVSQMYNGLCIPGTPNCAYHNNVIIDLKEITDGRV